MAVKNWLVGDLLTANDMNLWTVPLAVVTTSDQSITSQATLVNDNTLSLAIAASSTYQLHMHVVMDGPASNGAYFNFTGPSGATASLSSPVNGTASNNAQEITMNAGQVARFGLSTQGAGTNIICDVFGTIVVSSTAGTLQFQFSQTTSSGTATRRRAQSYLVLRRIA